MVWTIPHQLLWCVNRKELADNGDTIVLPNNTNIDLHKILALLYVYEISDEVLYSGWTIGNYFDGYYVTKNGTTYGKDSLCIGLIEAPNDKLVCMAEFIVRELNLSSALTKEKEKILLIETKELGTSQP